MAHLVSDQGIGGRGCSTGVSASRGSQTTEGGGWSPTCGRRGLDQQGASTAGVGASTSGGRESWTSRGPPPKGGLAQRKWKGGGALDQREEGGINQREGGVPPAGGLDQQRGALDQREEGGSTSVGGARSTGTLDQPEELGHSTSGREGLDQQGWGASSSWRRWERSTNGREGLGQQWRRARILSSDICVIYYYRRSHCALRPWANLLVARMPPISESDTGSPMTRIRYMALTPHLSTDPYPTDDVLMSSFPGSSLAPILGCPSIYF